MKATGVPLEHVSRQITSDNLKSLVIIGSLFVRFFFLRYQKLIIDSQLPGK